MAESKITKSEYRKLLWENPHAGSWDPSTHGDIILSSEDYDYLEFEVRMTGDNNTSYIRKVEVNTSNFLVVVECVDTSAITNNFLMGRIYTYISRTRFTPSSGIIVRWGQTNATTGNGYAVPVKIYGIKY